MSEKQKKHVAWKENIILEHHIQVLICIWR
jgi:hypothetical protein